MVNLQKLNGLSFKKGCYPGQEIVARMQYLGKLKREMRRFRGAGDDSAPHRRHLCLSAMIPMPVRSSMQYRSGDGFELLAVVKCQYGDDFTWQGAELVTLSLPYIQEDADVG